ncbi:TetR/AcrR family transcriptional regulator [Liquorilactobacillus capillatus]|uniref:TetR family transcriptional regulator n=1 Tax=Liquorilactobacillus capillatus DSM 19910 TaxID=1423731 RepID=A0A0R1M7X9_9LACO|nr:TetR/AcrR family transcriptional regulator [Liquorilactobacillus capillatus]KRL01157.1 TetR family transcriptional regulator [Liquorilactobacillus capillatus DSM 19910]
MSIKSDLRTKKTNKAIYAAFFQLISQKKFSEITINDIAKQAMINRSTFYLHYTDKYALLNTLVEDGITKVINSVSPKSHISDNKLDYKLFAADLSRSLQVIAGQAQLFKFILNDPESLGIRQRAEKALKKRLTNGFPLETHIVRDLFLEIVSSIYLSVICWWLNNDMKYSTSFLTQELVKFFEVGPEGLLTSD